MYHHSSNLSRNFTAVLTRAYVHTSCFSLRGALRDKLLRKSHSVTGPQNQTSATCNATFPTIARQVAQKIALCNRAFKCPLKWKAVNTPPPGWLLDSTTDTNSALYHLPKNSRNSSWKINGTHWFGIFQWKFSGKSGKSEIFILKFEMEVPENSYTIYMFLGTSQNLSWRGEGGGVEEKWNFSEQKFGTLLKSEKIFGGPPLPSAVGIFQDLSLAWNCQAGNHPGVYWF